MLRLVANEQLKHCNNVYQNKVTPLQRPHLEQSLLSNADFL